MTSEQFESIYNQIKQASKSNQLVVFIGAGMSNNFGFPTWNELIRQMYYALTGKEREAEQPFSSDELLRIPQALRLKDEAQYEKILKDNFGAHRVTTSDNAMLDEILKLKPKHIITTNFDTLIETYLREKEEAVYKEHNAREGYDRLVHNFIPYRYVPVIQDGDLVTADANHLLLKIHGDIQNMEALVLCEDDYLSYSESLLMENFIKSLLINHTFLFIGYGVGDSNLKMIMKWVDNILSRQKGGENKRRKHILFYAESSKMEELQKMYLEQKQIQVLEYMDIPQAFKETEVTEFADDRGKNLLRMLRAVSTRKKEILINDAKLEELFQYFKDRKYLHIREVCAFLGISRYEVQKNGNYLFFRRESNMELWLKKIVQTVEKKGETCLTKEAGLFLGKLGIQGYYNTDAEQPTEIASACDTILENLCLCSDYEELYRYVKGRKEFSYIEKACWALYVDNDEQANQWLQKQWESNKKITLYQQLQFAHNVQQRYAVQDIYQISFESLWNKLPEEEKKKLAVLQEYACGCAESYHAFGRIADKLRLRYSTKSYGEYYYDNEEFEFCRTQIQDFAKTLILNGFYITGLWSYTMLHRGIFELMCLYAETVLFMISPECRKKPEWFHMNKWDIYIFIYFISHDDLKKYLEKYKIKHLELEEDIKKILLSNSENMFKYFIKRTKNKQREGHLCARRIENCLNLMQLVEWNAQETTPLILHMFEYLTTVTGLSHNERCLCLSTEIIFSFLRKEQHKEQKELISRKAWQLLQKLMRKFLQEDAMNPNSHFLDNNADGYRDTGWLSSLIDSNEVLTNKRVIGQVWNTYQKRVGAGVSYLLCDIYDLAGVKAKKEISDYVLKKIRGLEAEKIRAFLEKGTLIYDEAVEAQLIRRCEAFAKLSDGQKKRSVQSQNPLTHVLRLWQKGIIPQIETFRPYKEENPWFSFVCFPEEFDYQEFQVEQWCTWLELERYRKKAFLENRRLLQKKFKKSIENGASEDVRRIYYKYIED